LQKFINAYDGDLTKAKDTLTKTLDWRAKTKPLDLLKKTFDQKKFGGLGYTTVYGDADGSDPEKREVLTWNIYGSVSNLEETFGNLQE
jgi:phosphatidylinositol transfer protein SFH5